MWRKIPKKQKRHLKAFMKSPKPHEILVVTESVKKNLSLFSDRFLYDMWKCRNPYIIAKQIYIADTEPTHPLGPYDGQGYYSKRSHP